MKKWLFSLLGILILILGSIYYFIPASLKVSSNVIINCTINGTNRYLLDDAKWYRWWPGDDTIKNSSLKGDSVLTYKGSSFQVIRSLYNAMEVLIEDNGLSIKSFINDFQLSKDSVAVQWQFTLKTSSNPITRWWQYQQARTIKTHITSLLMHLQSFLGKRANVYGIDIQEIYSRDTTVIVIKDLSDAYPEVREIYGLIEKLKKHILAENAIQTDYPMLHVRKVISGQFETMLAIPVNKPLKENSFISNKRFVPWKTLVAETKGGVYTIDQAYKKMELFIEDYQRTPMAIPFELLITDRSIQPDTLKWITVICQPVS